MAVSVSLRRSLRRIPEFRSLPGHILDSIIGRMTCKEYMQGEVLWRTSTGLDFFGIIQRGEVIVERRMGGSIVHSIRLTAGDHVRPLELHVAQKYLSIFARAVTDVRLYVLRTEQLEILTSKRSALDVKFHLGNAHFRSVPWRQLWVFIVALLTIYLIWNDSTRIISGLLYMASDRTIQSDNGVQNSLALLKYAESIDQNAAFAYDQEGLIKFYQNDLGRAEIAFANAYYIDQKDGSVLNNLAVTYFTTEKITQATIFLQQATQTNPNNAIIRYNLGLALLNQGYHVEALHEFKEATHIDPNWVLPYLQQALIYSQTQDYVNVEPAARATIRLDPSQQSAHLLLAIALYNQNRLHEALKSIENTLQIVPDDRVAQFYKALILKDLGERGIALSTLQQLLVSSTDSLHISRIQAEIESLNRSIPNIHP